MTTPTTQREADERAQKALAAITERLALTYRICCGTSPKQSVGELLDVTINMPEWEVVRAAIDQSTRQAAPMTYEEFFAEAKRLGCKLPPMDTAATDQPSTGPNDARPLLVRAREALGYCVKALSSLGISENSRRFALQNASEVIADIDQPSAGPAHITSHTSDVGHSFGDESVASADQLSAGQVDERAYEQAAQICDRLEAMMVRGGGELRPGERLAQAARMIRELGRASLTPAEHDYSDPTLACESCGLTMGESRTLGHIKLGILAAPQAASQQAEPDECAANMNGHSFGPHGRNGEQQCRWCGAPQAATTASACDNGGPCNYETRCADCPYAAPSLDQEAEDEATTTSACQHEFAYFDDQPARRCIHCDAFEVAPVQAAQPALPAEHREVIERAIRFIEYGSHTIIASDTMANELRKLLAAPGAAQTTDAREGLKPKHEAILRKAVEVVKARGHEGDARLADSVNGVIASLKADRATHSTDKGQSHD